DVLSLVEDKTYTFYYKITPVNASVRVEHVIDVPLTILSVQEVDAQTCNLSYQFKYKVMEGGLPVDKSENMSRLITPSMNLTEYVTNSTVPWDFFFIYKVNKTLSNETMVTIDDPVIGKGTITWDVDGLLKQALLNATVNMTIDGVVKPVAAMINAGLKPPAAIPGFPVIVVVPVMLAAVILTAIKVRREHVRSGTATRMP
nr:hypothetical protein [Candidatus Sigynarchaeota archaeon]